MPETKNAQHGQEVQQGGNNELHEAVHNVMEADNDNAGGVDGLNEPVNQPVIHEDHEQQDENAQPPDGRDNDGNNGIRLSQVSEPDENEEQPRRTNRKEILTRHLVTEHINRKKQEARDNNEADLGGFSKSKSGLATFAKVTGEVSNYLSLGSSAAGAVGNLGDYGYRESNDMAKEDSDNITDAFKTTTKAGEAVGGIGSALSTVSNVSNFFVNRKKAKNSKSKLKRSAGKFGQASNVFGALGGAAKATNSGFKLFGDLDNNKTNKSVSNYLGAGASVLGLAGSITGLIGNARQSSIKKDIRNNASAIMNSRENVANSGNERTDKHTLSAKNKAMKMANAMNKTHTSDRLKGVGGLLSGIGGAIMSFGNLFGAGFAKSGLFKGLNNVLSFAGKAFDMAAKKKAESAHKKDKLKYAKDELTSEAKINKIKRQARDMQLDNYERNVMDHGQIELTDNEACRIALARKGIEIEIVDKEIGNDYYIKAFEKMARKRARNIFLSEPNMKGRMLEALALDADASEKDIFEALCAD